MGIRVTDAEVKQIFNTTIDTTPFIRAANSIVENKLSGVGLGDEQLMEIERWLSAHFASIRDPVAVSERVGQTEIKYQGRDNLKNEGLESTFYGQNAIALDTSGTLKNINKRKANLVTLEPIDTT